MVVASSSAAFRVDAGPLDRSKRNLRELANRNVEVKINNIKAFFAEMVTFISFGLNYFD